MSHSLEPQTTTAAHRVFRAEAFAGRAFGITGGAHGIGRSMATLLLEMGASVLVMDQNADYLVSYQQAVAHHGSRAVSVWGDVADLDLLGDTFEQMRQKFGRIDGWVNNAGANPRLKLEQMTVEHMRRTMDINLLAAYQASQLAIAAMGPAGGGVILNIGSIMAHQTMAGSVAYSTTKAGLEGMTRALAIELAPQRIRVNAVLPGYILIVDPPAADASAEEHRSYQIVKHKFEQSSPWPRCGQPQDIAMAAMFLLSDAAEFITGTTLCVDGGVSVDLRDMLNPRRRQAFREQEAMGQDAR